MDYKPNKNVYKNNRVFFGTNKDGEKIYLSAPSFDCGWYWGIGYLGNDDCHYHLDNYADGRNINMHDALKNDYQLNPKIEKSLWEFCEIYLTIYSLKNTAEVLGRGGSHMTSNPCKNIIINKDEVSRINNEVLPSLFIALEEILISVTEDC